MYLRRTQRKRTDGTTVGYVQLAHNRRVDGVTRAEVLVNLGREDELDLDGLRRLAASITRFTDGDGGGGVLPGSAGEFEVTASRPMGGAWLLDALWKQLGVDRALRGVLGARRFTMDVERVLFALVANRALDPCSKLAAAEWVCEDAHIPGLDAMDEDQAYRAMDLLVEADAQAKVQEAVFFATADLLKPRGRPAVLRHHLDLLRARHARRRRRGRHAGVSGLRTLKGPPPRSPAGRDRARGHPGGDPGPRLGLARQHQRHERDRRGQGRPPRLATRPRGHRRRPRLLKR
jgi:hypothetical protein